MSSTSRVHMGAGAAPPAQGQHPLHQRPRSRSGSKRSVDNMIRSGSSSSKDGISIPLWERKFQEDEANILDDVGSEGGSPPGFLNRSALSEMLTLASSSGGDLSSLSPDKRMLQLRDAHRKLDEQNLEYQRKLVALERENLELRSEQRTPSHAGAVALHQSSRAIGGGTAVFSPGVGGDRMGRSVSPPGGEGGRWFRPYLSSSSSSSTGQPLGVGSSATTMSVGQEPPPARLQSPQEPSNRGPSSPAAGMRDPRAPTSTSGSSPRPHGDRGTNVDVLLELPLAASPPPALGAPAEHDGAGPYRPPRGASPAEELLPPGVVGQNPPEDTLLCGPDKHVYIQERNSSWRRWTG